MLRSRLLCRPFLYRDRRRAHRVLAAVAAAATVIGASCSPGTTRRTSPPGSTGSTGSTSSSTGRPSGENVYAAAGPGLLSETAKHALPRVYVPNRRTNNVAVIDPASFKVLAFVSTGPNPQHVVPAYDLHRLWVANNAERNSTAGSLTPFDPTTGTAGPNVAVEDPYNLYFTPDGASAIVVAEAKRRLDFRDPNTMQLRGSLSVPTCSGINHIDYSADGAYLLATCENNSRLVKIDWAGRKVLGTLELGASLPQDVRLSPDGRTFYVADMGGNRLILVDGDNLRIIGQVDLASGGGYGAHGIYPSRDATKMYVANRGSAARGTGPRRGQGSVSVVDVATNTVSATWPVPGGGSPDMGGVDAGGGQLWLSGRYDDEVYVFDTTSGRLLARIPMGPQGGEPHGLCVWPQPGRYSLGHTGNMR